MADRVELKEADLEQVVGGAFNFYTKNGKNKCYVDDAGTYFCTADAFSWVVSRTAGSSDSSKVVLQEAINLGLFWK